jgi:hypothetical protein
VGRLGVRDIGIDGQASVPAHLCLHLRRGAAHADGFGFVAEPQRLELEASPEGTLSSPWATKRFGMGSTGSGQGGITPTGSRLRCQL